MIFFSFLLLLAADTPRAADLKTIENQNQALSRLLENARAQPSVKTPPIPAAFPLLAQESQAEVDQKLEKAVADEIVKLIEELSRARRRDKSAWEYFKQAGNVEIKPVFMPPKATTEQEDKNIWDVFWQPLRLYSENHALAKIELPLDRRLLVLLNHELEDACGSCFQNQQEKARRIALFMAPPALADLEIARIMDRQNIPNYFHTTRFDPIRYFFESGALRSLLEKEKENLANGSLSLLPAEYAHLKQIGLANIAKPLPSAFKQETKGYGFDFEFGWRIPESVNDREQLFNLLKEKDPAKQLQRKESSGENQGIDKMIQRVNEGFGKMLHEDQAEALAFAQTAYLSENGMDALVMQTKLTEALIEANNFEPDAAERHLKQAKNRATGHGWDITAQAQTIEKKLRSGFLTYMQTVHSRLLKIEPPINVELTQIKELYDDLFKIGDFRNRLVKNKQNFSDAEKTAYRKLAEFLIQQAEGDAVDYREAVKEDAERQDWCGGGNGMIDCWEKAVLWNLNAAELALDPLEEDLAKKAKKIRQSLYPD